MKKQTLFLTLSIISIFNCAIADTAYMDDVRFFSHFQRDSAHSANAYVEGVFNYADDDDFESANIGAQGGIPLTAEIEIGLTGGYANVDPDAGSSESGLLDIDVIGKYHLDNIRGHQLTVGASLALPVGEKDIGQDRTDFGLFGTVRRPINEYLLAMGSIGLDFLDLEPDRETSLHLGGGIIYKLDSQLHLSAELSLDTEEDASDITGGVDYKMQTGGRIRGSFSLGLDNGTADFALQIGYLQRF